jgi:hypothetical protein
MAAYWLAFAGILLLMPSPWLALPAVVAVAAFVVTLRALSALAADQPAMFDYAIYPRGWRELASTAVWPSAPVVTALSICLIGALASLAVGFVRFLSA